MKVIKRNGQEVSYDINKIKNVISKANLQTKELSDEKIDKIVEDIDKKIQKSKFNLSVEDIQDIVEKDLIKYNAYETSKEYITFRYKRSLTRNNLDGQILSLIEYENEEVKQENSNKNPRILSVQRDYMAGVISKDISERILLPKEIVQAHKEGIIHFHDMDYFAQHAHNCALVNLEDMLQNGTVISGVGIDKPKSFRTACTIASQIVAQVASSQYGGQTISLSHLVPFVEISRQKIKKELKEELQSQNIKISDEKFNNLVETKVKKEINDGIQIIQYQLITLQTTNGQAPFVSVMMYLNEVHENERDDLALLIESMLKQRIKGVKNSEGVYITPAFPKLLYVLQEDNIKKSGKYYYLTKLAAECTAKRMVPDYISEKIMLDLKGDVYPCMGCLDYNEKIEINNTIFKIGEFAEALEELFLNKENFKYKNFSVKDSKLYFKKTIILDIQKELPEIKRTDNGKSVVFDLINLNKEIKSNNKNTKLYGILYNRDISNWLKITYRYGKRETHVRSIVLTTDHPLPTVDGVVHRADELKIGDKLIRVNPYTHNQFECAEIINIEKVEKTSKSYDVTTETEYFDINSDILSHNCRSYLTPDRFTKVGKHKYYGRFNQGVVTLNLVDVALSSEKNENKFWDLLDSRLELCHRALQERHKRLKGTLSDVAPIMWQYGALARLEPGQVIDDLLYHGYSTISLGYAGLFETTKYMTDNSHTSEKGKEFALKVMQKLNDKCQEWKLAEDIDYSVYGSPIESGTYRFAKLLQKKFGIIEGITDKNYITNSYHVAVTEKIDAFSKLIKESAFQKLSPGGAISYVEVPNMVNNLEAVMSVLECIYENIQYAELNTRSDYCCNCKFTGEIPLVNEDNKLIWKCPKCGCTDTTKLVITRRTCGYIGTAENGWNQGRLADINNRVLHL